MAVRAKTIAVTTTPAVAVDASKSTDGISATLSNVGISDVYVGGDDLTNLNTATNGIKISAGAGMDDLDLPYGEQLFVVVPTGTGSVAVLSTRV